MSWTEFHGQSNSSRTSSIPLYALFVVSREPSEGPEHHAPALVRVRAGAAPLSPSELAVTNEARKLGGEFERVRRPNCLEGPKFRDRCALRKHMALHRGPLPAPTDQGQR